MERKPKKKLKKDEKGAVETILEEEIVKHYLEAKYFQYSDFNVNLEEVILNPVGSGVLTFCAGKKAGDKHTHTGD